jgi:hypothetical protein
MVHGSPSDANERACCGPLDHVDLGTCGPCQGQPENILWLPDSRQIYFWPGAGVVGVAPRVGSGVVVVPAGGLPVGDCDGVGDCVGAAGGVGGCVVCVKGTVPGGQGVLLVALFEAELGTAPGVAAPWLVTGDADGGVEVVDDPGVVLDPGPVDEAVLLVDPVVPARAA